MIPALQEHGYPEKYALGLMTTSPNLGVIIPPSISMILYSMISNVSLEGLFSTGFPPRIVHHVGSLSLFIFSTFATKKILRGCRRLAPEKFLAVFKEGFWALMLPIIIFGGIFSGVFTANEAAVVACVYALFVELFIHKSMNFRDVEENNNFLGRDIGNALDYRRRSDLFWPFAHAPK